MAATEILPASFRMPDGVTLAADIAGDAWLPRLVFVHGGGPSRRSWSKALQVIAARGFSVVSYDLRGHGDSDWSETGDYSLETHARDLATIITAMPSPPALVAASFGGYAALETAAMLGPEKIRALVLVDVAPRMGPAGRRRLEHFLETSSRGFATIEDAIFALESFVEHRISSDAFQRADFIRTGNDGRFHWRWDPLSIGRERLPDAAGEERLAKAASTLRCPVLLVRGTESDLVPDDSVAHLLSVQPEAEVVDVVGAGHLLRADHLPRFCEATVRFLRKTFAQVAAQQ